LQLLTLLLYHRLLGSHLPGSLLLHFGDALPEHLVFALQLAEGLVIQMGGFGADHVLKIERSGLDLDLSFLNWRRFLQFPELLEQLSVQGFVLDNFSVTSLTNLGKSSNLLV
jgi:hypothetical protein